MTICVYCSEISALVGRNRWTTPAEALQKVRDRVAQKPKEEELSPLAKEYLKAVEGVDDLVKINELQHEYTSMASTMEEATQVNCATGNLVEASVVKETGIQGNQQSFSKFIFHGDYKYKIFGRVDGIDDEKKRVIEIKSRKNRLYSKIFCQEYIQIQIYMFLSDLSECQFIESHGNERYEEIVSYDAEFVSDVLDALSACLSAF